MKAWISYALALSVVVLFGTHTAYAAEIGELDTTFGDGGKVITSFDQFGGQAYAVALQADGKILAAGSASNGYDLDIAIARYNEDGSLDTSFGKEGKLMTSLGDGDEEITAIDLQDDGYIVAAGFTTVDGARSFLLVRFTPDGVFDNSFGEGGKVVTQFGNQRDEITAMTIDDEGRIVVCGFVTGTAGNVVVVSRYLESGALDITFGDQGAVLTDIGGEALARSIDIDAEGRIVITGSYSRAEQNELMLLRFLGDGVLDTGFGEQAIAVPADRETASEGYGVGLMEDGTIMVAGAVGQKGDQDSALFRFTESGQPDSTFGDNGVLITSAGDEDDMALSIDVLDNLIGLSGYTTFNTKRDFLFVAVEGTNNDGANVALNADSGGFVSSGGRKFASVFDLEGNEVVSQGETEEDDSEKSVFSTTQFGYTDDISYAVVLQPDGKAISVGLTVQDDISSFAVARYVTPVANAAAGGGGVDTPVSWIVTKEPTNVDRTGGFTGGTIYPSGLTISQRGVVYSIAPDPVYEEGSGGSDSGSGGSGGSGSGGSGGGSGNDTTAPTVSITSPSSGQEFSADVGQVDLKVTSNEPSLCSYSAADVSFNSMKAMAPEDTNTNTFIASLPVENGTSYTYYVICRDLAENESGKKQVTFSVAASSVAVNSVSPSASVSYVSAPTTEAELSSFDGMQSAVAATQPEPATSDLVITNGSPYGEIAAGSSMTYIGVYTNEKAVCKFTDLPGLDYDSMPEAMATADNLSHIARVDGLQDDFSYTFFVSCRDFAGYETASDYEVSFSVASSGNQGMKTLARMTRNFRDFILPSAVAQTADTGTGTGTDSTTGTTDTNTPSSVFDLSAPAYSIEGSTSNGAGEGSYSAILDNLKPGTFYYVRAYALDSNGKVYYGNQVGLKTADSCFIATAAYGTLLHPYVQVLRDFRDQYMITNVIGRNLVNLYYHYSPPVADYIAARPVVRGVVRTALLPVVGLGWLALHIGFTGLALLFVFIFMPSLLVYRSYRRLEVH